MVQRRADHPLGYVVAIAICLVQAGVYGSMNCFPVFLQNMSEDESLGKPSLTSISFGNSVAVGLSPVFGTICGRLVDFIGPRVMMVICSLCIAGGMVLSSHVANSAVTLVFSYSLLASLSSAFMTSPGVMAVGSWFEKNREFAMGIAYSGGGWGMLLPMVAAHLLAVTGDWRKSFRYLAAFACFPLFAAGFVFLRNKTEEEEQESTFLNQEGHEDEHGTIATEDLHVAHRRRIQLMPILALLSPESLFAQDFVSLYITSTFFGFAFYTTLFVTVPYAQAIGQAPYAEYENIDTAKAATLSMYFGIAEGVGSVLLGLFASRLNNRLIFGLFTGIGSVAFGFWAFSRSYAAMSIAVTVIGGSMAGAMAVLPAIVCEHFHGPNTGMYVALNTSSLAIGGFSGPPIVTALTHHFNGDYTIGIVVVGISLALSGLCAVLVVPKEVAADRVPKRSPRSKRQIERRGHLFPSQVSVL